MTATNMCSNFGGFRCSPPLFIVVMHYTYSTIGPGQKVMTYALKH